MSPLIENLCVSLIHYILWMLASDNEYKIDVWSSRTFLLMVEIHRGRRLSLTWYRQHSQIFPKCVYTDNVNMSATYGRKFDWIWIFDIDYICFQGYKLFTCDRLHIVAKKVYVVFTRMSLKLWPRNFWIWFSVCRRHSCVFPPWEIQNG